MVSTPLTLQAIFWLLWASTLGPPHELLQGVHRYRYKLTCRASQHEND